MALTLGSLFDGIGGWQLAAVHAGIKPVWSAEIEAFPIEVTRRHFPDTLQLGDVTKIDGGNIPPVDIICAGSPCFAAGTMVMTKDGAKPIEQIRIGDDVITHNRTWECVTQTMKHGTKDLYLLKAEGAEPTRVTGNHPYYVRHMKRQGHLGIRTFSKPEWVDVEDLKVGDCIGYPIDESTSNPARITDEEAWLMGRYVADGYINDAPRTGRENQYNHKVVYCVGKGKEAAFVAILGSFHACGKPQRTVTKFEIVSERLAGLCKLCGRGAENKHIPKEVLSLPKETLRMFIDGYMSGDGCYIASKNIHKATTISKRLAYDLQFAVQKAFSVPCSIYYTERPKTHEIEGRVVNQHDTYQVTFKNGIPKQTHCCIEGGIIWRRVRSCEKLDGCYTVYNLEVGDSHSYTANGAIVHNCQDLSIAGKRAGLAGERSGLFVRAVDIVRQMRRATDGEKPRFFVWENVPGAFSSNHRRDFQAVLEEIGQAEVPMPKSGRWADAGLVRTHTCDIAWRVLDAQYWGVPQRRKRIFLVADFAEAGRRAGEILFEPEGVQGDTPQGEGTRKGTAAGTQSGAGTASLGLDDQGGGRMDAFTDIAPTMRAQAHNHPPVVHDATVYVSGRFASFDEKPVAGSVRAAGGDRGGSENLVTQ